MQTGGGFSNGQHEKFWEPVIERLIAGILEAKHVSDDPAQKGCVFVLWGNIAQKLKKVIMRVNTHQLPIRFVEVRWLAYNCAFWLDSHVLRI